MAVGIPHIQSTINFLEVEERETNLMSLALLFHYLMLNMFRMY